jgi:hypothetical protein
VGLLDDLHEVGVEGELVPVGLRLRAGVDDDVLLVAGGGAEEEAEQPQVADLGARRRALLPNQSCRASRPAWVSEKVRRRRPPSSRDSSTSPRSASRAGSL